MVVFRAGMTLRAQLTNVKDRLPHALCSNVVYQVPCSCGRQYIRETVRRLETRIKEHPDACRKCELEKSVITENAWNDHHSILWKEALVMKEEERTTLERGTTYPSHT